MKTQQRLLVSCYKDAKLQDLEAIQNLMHLSKSYWGYNDEYLNKFMTTYGISEELIGFYSFSATNQLTLDDIFIKPQYIKQGRSIDHTMPPIDPNLTLSIFR